MLSRTTLIVLLLSLLSCHADGSLEKEANSMAPPEAAAYGMDESAEDTDFQNPSSTTSPKDKEEETVQELILIKQGHCRLEVNNIDHVMNRIQLLVAEQQGYISDLNVNNNTWRKETTCSLRVPATQFQNTLDSIKSLAKKVEHQRISTLDVTEEYVDITSRLETKKQVRDRYIDILRNKAKTVEDVLMAEEKIRQLQEEIESREGRLRYLRNRSSMSTITVELFQELDPKEETIEATSWVMDFLEDAGESLGFGGQLVRGIILGLMAIWPLLLFVGILLWRRKKIRAYFSRKNTNH